MRHMSHNSKRIPLNEAADLLELLRIFKKQEGLTWTDISLNSDVHRRTIQRWRKTDNPAMSRIYSKFISKFLIERGYWIEYGPPTKYVTPSRTFIKPGKPLFP